MAGAFADIGAGGRAFTPIVLVGVGMLIWSGSSGCGVEVSFCLLGGDNWCSSVSRRDRSLRYEPGNSSYTDGQKPVKPHSSSFNLFHNIFHWAVVRKFRFRTAYKAVVVSSIRQMTNFFSVCSLSWSTRPNGNNSQSNVNLYRLGCKYYICVSAFREIKHIKIVTLH